MKWLLAIVVLLAIALSLQLELMAHAMYVLLGLFAISRLLARRWIADVEVSRECNRQVAEIGDSAAVVVALRNRGRLPIGWLLAEDALPWDALVGRPPRLRVSGRRLTVAMLPPGGRRTLFYQLHFEGRGYFQVGPLVLETGDLFGLHRRHRIASEPRFVLVYPRVVPLAGYDVASRRPIGEVRISHRLYEDPTRVSGVRWYEPGDPLNRIHWRATARTGRLHSKTYEASTVAGATIVLDFHRQAYPARHEPFGSELAVTTAASLANAVYQLGEQVGLVSNARDAVDRIRLEGWEPEPRGRRAARESVGMRAESDRLRPLEAPTRRGAEQLTRILEILARAELTDGLPLEALIEETTSRLPRDASVIAVTSQVSPRGALALGNLRRRGLAVTVVLVNLDEFDASEAAGRLLAEGIDVRRVTSEEELAALCQPHLVR